MSLSFTETYTNMSKESKKVSRLMCLDFQVVLIVLHLVNECTMWYDITSLLTIYNFFLLFFKFCYKRNVEEIV